MVSACSITVEVDETEIRVPNISSAGKGVLIRVRVFLLALRHHNDHGRQRPEEFLLRAVVPERALC